MSRITVKVPDIGDFGAVEIIEVLVAEGDTVAVEDGLVSLESDKATMDVPSTAAGTVAKLLVGVGDKVAEGDAVAEIEAEDADAADEAQATDVDASEASDETPDASAAGESDAAEAGGKGESEAGDSDGQEVEVTVPDIGDFDAVEIIEVLVAQGDAVEVEQGLVTLESDKATMDVPSTVDGTLVRLAVGAGDSVSQGDVVAVVRTAGSGKPADSGAQDGATKQSKAKQSEASQAEPPAPRQSSTDRDQPASASKPQQSTEQPARDDPTTRSGVPAHASPAVRKFARELGVTLKGVKGSGPKGRILKEDVQSHVKAVMKSASSDASVGAGGGLPSQPDVDFSKFGDVETVELARIRKLSSKHLHKSWLLIPHVTQFAEADVTDLEAFRQAEKDKHAAKLTMLPLLIKAVSHAIDRFPEFASSLTADGNALVMKHYRHIGFAADTPNGLVVPVVKNVDRKGVIQIAAETAELAKKARDGKLGPGDMQGAVFSISSLGGIGGTAFTPIVNSPEVAILGVSRNEVKPVWNGSEFLPRTLMPLSLSYDHRVIDGAAAARFIVYLTELLADYRRVLL